MDNLTREQLRTLGNTAAQAGISTPEELQEVITLGARIRIYREDILRFTETVSRMMR